jgi:hypothetical protein
MIRLAALLLVSTFPVMNAAVYAQATPGKAYSIDALQGAWWQDCEQPAAEFFISDDEYSGDFEGSYKATLTGDLLVFDDGFADGHSVNVTHVPLEFRIVELTNKRLVLSPLPGNPFTSDWHLQSCDEPR